MGRKSGSYNKKRGRPSTTKLIARVQQKIEHFDLDKQVVHKNVVDKFKQLVVAKLSEFEARCKKEGAVKTKTKISKSLIFKSINQNKVKNQKKRAEEKQKKQQEFDRLCNNNKVQRTAECVNLKKFTPAVSYHNSLDIKKAQLRMIAKYKPTVVDPSHWSNNLKIDWNYELIFESTKLRNVVLENYICHVHRTDFFILQLLSMIWLISHG